MSRVANAPINLPKGVDFNLNGQDVVVKGAKGQLEMSVHPAVAVEVDGDAVKVSGREGEANSVAMAGTMRALLSNMVTGVSAGFERRLDLVGVDLFVGTGGALDTTTPGSYGVDASNGTGFFVDNADVYLAIAGPADPMDLRS